MKTLLSASFAFTLLLFATSVQADGRVRTWGGDNTCGAGCLYRTDTSWISNVVAIAAGSFQSLALKADATVIGWGANADTNFPAGLSNIVSIAAYGGTSMALRNDGSVVVWGSGSTVPASMPFDLQDVVAISAGRRACIVLKSNGTVVAWGSEGTTLTNGQSTLSNVVAISAGAYHALALRSDGTVAAWPDSSVLSSPYPYANLNYGQVDIPPGLAGVVAVAAGAWHSLALKSDGTVVAWGSGNNAIVPPGLNNVVAVSAGDGVSLALKADGTVVEWNGPGSNGDFGQFTVPRGLSNVVAIASGGGGLHNLALYSAEPIIRTQPSSRSVTAGETVLFSVTATSPGPMTFLWRFNGTNIAGATNTTLSVTNAQASDTGFYDVVLCSSYGCVTSKVATLSFKVASVQMMAAITVQGLPGANTRVDWSTDLNTWNTLTNFTLPFSPFKFADWDSLGQPRRFYRVVFEP